MQHIGARVYVTAIVMLISSVIAGFLHGARRVRTPQDGI
jgi:hypothetical protein